MSDTNIYNKLVGLLKVGAVSDKGYNAKTGTVSVQLNDSVAVSNNAPIDIGIPLGLFYSNGVFIGSLPAPGTPVVVGQESGGKHHFVSFLAQNPKLLPKLKLGEILIRTNDNTKITLDLSNVIDLGSNNNKLHINTNNNLISSNFNNQYSFTQAARHIDGIVKRDLSRNINIPQSLKLDDDLYESKYSIICLDPMSTFDATSSGSRKNPPLVENRELIYEFQYSSNVKNELIESNLYSDKPQSQPDLSFINRRQCRADTLSLTLLEPNYLMEITKGTVIDIFGNILDLNRIPLSVGMGQKTLRPDKSSDRVQSYLQIRELERKSLAFHFEINARKDLTGLNGKLVLPDINSNADYARNRSRFFIDVDKEGQFKINVPASSEKGNIPLLTRYENFSSFYKDENGATNPNQLIYRDDNLDIFQDSFAAPFQDHYINEPNNSSNNRGSITISDGSTSTTPTDRITQNPLKHGTAYHDILSTCYLMLGTDFIRYQNDPSVGGYRNIDVDSIATLNSHLSNIVTNTIYVDGSNPNAGGRSGSINLDGSLELNVGANTIDRQSLWLDFAGGVVGNIGRDLKNTSLAMNMDGDVFVQLGGFGVATDSRFSKQNNGNYGATLDLRVMTDGGYVTMIRIDKQGVQILTPSCVQIHSGQGTKITSDGDISIDAETLTLQGRAVQKGLLGSI